MGSDLVVGLQPSIRELPHLAQTFKQMRIEHFVSIRSIKPFNERVLVGLAGLDVADLDLVLVAPVNERLRQHLRRLHLGHRLVPGYLDGVDR